MMKTTMMTTNTTKLSERKAHGLLQSGARQALLFVVWPPSEFPLTFLVYLSSNSDYDASRFAHHS